jgi:hypothetical protein
VSALVGSLEHCSLGPFGLGRAPSGMPHFGMCWSFFASFSYFKQTGPIWIENNNIVHEQINESSAHPDKQHSSQANKKRPALAVGRLMAGWKSIVPAPSDRDPVGETSRDIVLQFSPSVFTKQTRGTIVGADLC